VFPPELSKLVRVANGVWIRQGPFDFLGSGEGGR